MADEKEQSEISPEMAKSMRDRLRVIEVSKKIKHKIVVMSGKGGVGKSTVAAGLACVFARNGKAGILDADVTGPDIPMIMGVEHSAPKAGKDLLEPVEGPLGIRIISMQHLLPEKDAAVIWRGPLKIQALRQMLVYVNWGELDYLVIDLPPGTSDEPLSIAQDIPDVDGAVVVTTPQELSLLDVRKSINFAKAVDMRVLGVIENMSGYTCPKCGHKEALFKTGGGKRMAEKLGIPFLGSIPMDPSVVIGGDAGKPFVLEHPDSPATKAFESIVDNLKKELAKVQHTPKFKPVGVD
jgi:ATP-binding protein involved in chromosome partitioning